ncbi:hypothetical protein PM007_09730 [[Clostridium] symbiosum]|nr:hypothetical protein [[Clostridium] symbiosum]
MIMKLGIHWKVRGLSYSSDLMIKEKLTPKKMARYIFMKEETRTPAITRITLSYGPALGKLVLW